MAINKCLQDLMTLNNENIRYSQRIYREHKKLNRRPIKQMTTHRSNVSLSKVSVSAKRQTMQTSLLLQGSPNNDDESVSSRRRVGKQLSSRLSSVDPEETLRVEERERLISDFKQSFDKRVGRPKERLYRALFSDRPSA